MNKVYYLFLLVYLISCGEKHAISYKEYEQLHERNREEHVRLIKQDAQMLDTLLTQDMDIISREFPVSHSRQIQLLLECWDLTSEELKESSHRHQIYTGNVIYNDKTSKSIQMMWIASSDLGMMENTELFDIRMMITAEIEPEQLIDQIKLLKKKLAGTFAQMLKGAEEYNKIVLGDDKKSPN
jgi:hypothetical protein